jgi:hypothetical protein
MNHPEIQGRITMVGTRFAIVFVVLGLLVAMPVRAQDTEDAGKRYDKGVQLFKSGNFEGALVEFRAAYESAPHFKVRFNIGVTLYHLHRYVEAEAELKAFIKEGGDGVDADNLTEAEAILYELAQLIGTLTVDCDVKGAVLIVDGEEIGPLPLAKPLRLDVGEYDVEIQHPKYKTFSEKISVAGEKIVGLDAKLVALKGAPKLVDREAEKCAASSDCSEKDWICHKSECIPPKLKLGKTLLIAGASVGGSGLLIAGVGFIMGSVSYNYGVVVGGWVMAVTGLVMIAGSVGLIVPGVLMMKKAKRSMLVEAEASLTPYLGPLPDGGFAFGMSGLF